MNKLLRAAFVVAAAYGLYAQFPPLVITTQSPLPFAVRGQGYITSLSASGGGGGYFWEHESEGNPLPPGFSVNSGGSINSEGVGAPVGDYTFDIRVSSNSEASATKTFLLSVYERLVVTPATLPAATRNSPYSTTVTATGGSSTTYTWTLATGSLPTGVTLNPTTGQISGVPTSVATVYNFSLTARDPAGQVSAPQTFNLIVNEQPLSISPPFTLATGAVGVPYTQILSATGGNGVYSWSILTGGTGLPAGLSLTSGGTLQGTPTASGPFTFRARVADSSTFQPQAQSADFSLTINPQLVITSTSLPAAVVATPYSAQLAATGGQAPVSWAVTSGPLPPGLSISSAGLITGTPTAPGGYPITVQASDAGSVPLARQGATRNFTIAVAFPPLTIGTTSLAQATAFVPYSQGLLAAGGNPPYTWALTAGRLPNGVTLTGSGSLSGTPTESGNFPITLRVRDNQNQPFETFGNFTLAVDPGNPQITTGSLPIAQPQTNYSFAFAAVGGTPPYSFALIGGALPSGFVFTSDGRVLGSAPDAASSNFTVRVTDIRGRSSEKGFTLAVAPRTPETELRVEIATASLPDATVGRLYGMTLAARNGRQPYTWGIAGLPSGLVGNTRGEISGTPTRSGTFPLQIAVTDDTGGRTTGTLNLVVKGSIVITPERVPDGRVGEAYSAAFAASGGIGPYAFSFLAGSTPPGLTFNANGVLTGTPTTAGTFQFTVQVTDVNGEKGARDYSLSVARARLSITTTSLANGSVGSAYSAGLAATGGRAPFRWTVSGLPETLTVDASTGAISGTPNRAGSFPITAQVTDQDNQTASRDLTLEITAGVVITTTSVGNFVVGTASSASLAASGGRPPYTWSVTGGALPAGLTLGQDGSITGSANTTGQYSFTVQVRDQGNQTASRTFTGSVVTGLTITTQSMPAATVNAAYTAALAATGGTPPYRWSTTGVLPTGLVINADGSLTGTPTAAGTFNFTAIVTDSATSAQTAQRALSITVALPSISGLTILVPANPQPQQQPNIGVTLDQSFPVDITGTLTLTFAPNTANNSDDPFIEFSTGGRSVPFTIASGQTQAVFRLPTVGVQTGTTAGTITLTTTLLAGGIPINCNCQLTRTIVIPRGAPVITNLRVQRASTGFTVVVTGFSTSREVTQATVRFVGTNLQTTELTVPLTTAFNSWFQGAASQQFGGQFTLTIPFTTQGESSSVSSVSVVLTNGAGSSQPSTASF